MIYNVGFSNTTIIHGNMPLYTEQTNKTGKIALRSLFYDYYLNLQ